MEKHLGRYIKGLLRQRGIRQADAAKQIGVAPETLNRWLSGQEVDENAIRKLTLVMPDLINLMQEFKTDASAPKAFDEVEFLRRENAQLQLRLEKAEETAERLLRLLESQASAVRTK